MRISWLYRVSLFAVFGALSWAQYPTGYPYPQYPQYPPGQYPPGNIPRDNIRPANILRGSIPIRIPRACPAAFR